MVLWDNLNLSKEADIGSPTEYQDARLGERMIELKVRFWTDGIVEGKGRIKPKHAWTRG